MRTTPCPGRYAPRPGGWRRAAKRLVNIGAVLEAAAHRAAKLALALPDGGQGRLAGGAPTQVDGMPLPPPMQLAVAGRRRRHKAPLRDIGPAGARAQLRAETPIGAGP